MNKSELIDRVANATGETKRTVGAVIDALSETITDTLKVGGEVTLPGVGKLQAAKRAARVGRNPRTGEETTIPASVAPKFKASKTLKDALN